MAGPQAENRNTWRGHSHQTSYLHLVTTSSSRKQAFRSYFLYIFPFLKMLTHYKSANCLSPASYLHKALAIRQNSRMIQAKVTNLPVILLISQCDTNPPRGESGLLQGSEISDSGITSKLHWPITIHSSASKEFL